MPRSRMMGNGLNMGGIGSPAGGGGVTYIIRAEYATPASAPLSSSIAMEVGYLKKSSDTGNRASITGGNLAFSTGGGLTGDPGYYLTTAADGAVTRSAGRSAVFEITPANISCDFEIGWMDSTTVSTSFLHGVLMRNAGSFSVKEGAAASMVLPHTYTAATHQIWIALLASGSATFVKGGNYASVTLMWTTAVANTASLYPAYTHGAQTFTSSYQRVADVSSVATLPTTINVASPTADTDYTGDADGFVDLTLASGGTITTNGGVRFRVVDASNYWYQYFDTTGAYKIDSVSAGTPTTRVNIGSVTTTSATRTMRAAFLGSALAFYSQNGTTWTKRGATLSLSTHASATGVRTDFGAGWTASNLIGYPATNSAYNALANI